MLAVALVCAAGSALLKTASAEIALLSSPDEKERLMAASAVKEQNDPSQIPMIAAAINKEDSPAVRAALAEVLGSGRYRNNESFAALTAILREDLSSEVRKTALLALLAHEDGRVFSVLEPFFKAEQGASVRQAACSELGKSAFWREFPQAAGILASVLTEDLNAEVRLSALRALETREDKSALPSLRRAAEGDSDLQVRRAAKKAVRKLSSIPSGRPVKKIKKPSTGDYESIKGRDKCGRGNGWCECSSGLLTPRPRCMSREDCKHIYETSYRHHGYTCTWDSQNLE